MIVILNERATFFPSGKMVIRFVFGRELMIVRQQRKKEREREGERGRGEFV